MSYICFCLTIFYGFLFSIFDRINNNLQYIQVDFLAPYQVGGIVTQGQQDQALWVTKYEVYYSRDGRHFYPITTSSMDKSPKTFTGNQNQNTPITHEFPLVMARYIRLKPFDFTIWIMKSEF